MRKILLFLVSLGILALIVRVLLPATPDPHELSPDLLLREIEDPARYLTTDAVAELLISEDPAVVPVDLRSPEAYAAFHLNRAVNIPVATLLEADNLAFINRPGMKTVFYTDCDILSEQAWILMRRMKYDNIFLMKGGLNKWAMTILNPAKPAETADQAEWDQYEFRKAACRYFAGASIEIDPPPYAEPKTVARPAAPPKQEIKLTPKPPPEEEEEEGC
jgi:rhodanese-related sulfurtransferase